MKRASFLVVFIAVVAVSFAGCTPSKPSSGLQAKIDQYMNAAAEYEHFMGSILVAKGDDIIIAKGYGMADVGKKIPVTADTRFRIGSVTKQFTAMAILMLQAEGKLDIHDSVCKYVPKCPEAWQPITIYNLLTHTSGIPSFTSFPNYMQVRSQSMTPEQLLALFRDKPLEFKPGTKFSYSNSGYVLLGYIIERVSGEGYGQFLEEHIFEPLGMQDSGYAKSHPTAKSFAKGYRYAGDEYQPASFVDMSVPFSAGALYSTVRDLYTWDRALDAGKLLPQSLHKLMFAPQVSVRGDLAELTGGDEAVHYGFGWFVKEEFGRKLYSHEGGIAGFTSFNGWFPTEHVYIIVLDNMSSPRIFKVARDLAAIVFGEEYKIPKPFEEIDLPTKALEKFVGTYQMAPELFMTVTRSDGHLKAQLTGQPAIPIYPESATRFFAKAVRAEIVFQVNEQGRVTGLALHQNGREINGNRVSAEKARQATATPNAISLSPEKLRKFVGTYRLTPNFAITITLEGNQLQAQATGQPAAYIYPSSKTEFFYKVVDAQITFQLNEKGEVTGLVLHQSGRDIPARKVK